MLALDGKNRCPTAFLSTALLSAASLQRVCMEVDSQRRVAQRGDAAAARCWEWPRRLGEVLQSARSNAWRAAGPHLACRHCNEVRVACQARTFIAVTAVVAAAA